MLATARWKSAFDATRKAEKKTEAESQRILDVLKSHPIFGKIKDESLLDEVVGATRTARIKINGTVITQGEAGDAFYIVAEGTFAAYVHGKEVATYKEGDSFGELALMYDSPRAATVKCTAPFGGALYRLGRIAFRNNVMAAMQKAKAGLEERLAQVPVLSCLSAAQIHRLAEAMEPTSFADKSIIARVGDVADSLFVVLSGEVACYKDESQGDLQRLPEGSVFGEACLMPNAAEQRRQANVVAVGRVRCARLTASDCAEILGDLQQALSLAFLRKVMGSLELFQGLAPSEMTAAMEAMKPRAVEAGEVVLAQGAVGDTFYLIKVGEVDVIAAGDDGEPPARINTLSGGDYFGERSLLKGEPANASIVATEATELMCLPKARFEELLGPMQALLDREVARRDAQRKSGGAAIPIKYADLDLRQVLGEGSFGCVRLAIHKTTRTAYALKAMHKGHLISTNQVKNTVTEKSIMRQVDHPFILKCSGTFNQPKHVQLLLGLCPGGELFNLMSRVGTLKAESAAIYVAMVASALGFLSARNIAHRDLKLENLLFDDKGYLKLVDFGFAKVVESRTWTFCGTPDYLAPEILSQSGHNFAVDWWTLGILTYEMLHGEPPFCEDDQMATFKRIAALDYTIKESVPEDAKKLIKGLLHATPSKRHGMRASAENGVLKHKFCAHVDVEKLLKKEMSDLPFVPLVKDPTDCSSFDALPPMSSSWMSDQDKYMDAKYDSMWKKEFGEV